MRDDLWSQIEAALPPSEVEEARSVIGSQLVESVEDAMREVSALEEILDLYREQLDEERQRRQARPLLPPPPVLEYVEREIQFFIGHLRERAGEHGHTDADALIRPQTPAEDRVLRYVTRKADGRPATAPGQWRRPHTVDGSPSRPVPSSPAAAARPGTAVSLSSLLPDQKVSVAVVGQAGVQERLRAALRAEHKALVQYAERIREWLDEEHEEAHEEAEAAAVEKPPALSDMRVYSGRLQEQYLCPDSLAAFFGPTDGARGAMLPAAAATAAVPAPAPAPASLVPAAALAPLAPPRRVAGGTPAAAAAVAAPFALGSQSAAAAAAAATMATTPAAAVGGAINHAAVGAAAGGRVARVARLRQQVGLAREMHSAEWAIK